MNVMSCDSVMIVDVVSLVDFSVLRLDVCVLVGVCVRCFVCNRIVLRWCGSVLSVLVFVCLMLLSVLFVLSNWV